MGAGLLPWPLRAAGAPPPRDNPLASLKLAWTDSPRWEQVVEVTTMPGATPAEQLAAAQTLLVAKGGGVVYFPAGNYRFLSALTVPGGCVLRGERSSNTTLTIEHISDGISITRAQSGVFQPVVSGYAIHSSSIVVTDGSVFAAGDYAEIREDNDAAWGASTGRRKSWGRSCASPRSREMC